MTDPEQIAELARTGHVEFVDPAYQAPPAPAPGRAPVTGDLCPATYDMDNGYGMGILLECDQKPPHPGLIHHSPAGFWWGRCDLDHEHREAVG